MRGASTSACRNQKAVCFLYLIALFETSATPQAPSNHSQVIVDRMSFRHRQAGDVVIAVLVPIFSNSADANLCSEYNFVDSGLFLVVEPFLYTLRKRNFQLGDPDTSGNITVGYELYSTCRSRLRAVQDSLTTTWFSTSSLAARLREGTTACDCASFAHEQNSTEKTCCGGASSGKVAAVMGTNSVPMGNLLAPLFSAFNIPYVNLGPSPVNGYMSQCWTFIADQGNSYIDNRAGGTCYFENEYLFQTVSSTIFYVEAILDVLEKFGWWHVGVISDNSLEGGESFNTLLQQVVIRNWHKRKDGDKRRICVDFSAILPDHLDKNEEGKEVVLEDILKQINGSNSLERQVARVIIMMAPLDPAVMLFKYIVKRVEGSHSLPRVWLATQWGADYSIYQNEAFKNATIETLIVLWPSPPEPFRTFVQESIQQFASYIEQVTIGDIDKRQDNPWLCLEYQAFFPYPLCRGRFDNLCVVNTTAKGLYDRCIVLSHNTSSLNGSFNGPIKLNFTAGVYTVFATEVILQAIDDLWRNYSAQNMHVPLEIRKKAFGQSLNGQEMKEAILHVQLPCGNDYSANRCNVFNRLYDDLHEPFPTYVILIREQQSAENKPQLSEVGTWMKTTVGHGAVTLSEISEKSWGRMLDKVNEMRYPKSSCQVECGPGAVPVEDKHSALCCQKCVNCTGRDYADVDLRTCVRCKTGFAPTPDHMKCVNLPERLPARLQMGLIIVLALGVPLLMVVLVTLGIMAAKRSSSVVKLSDTFLSFTTLVAMALAALSLFLLYLPTTKTTCRITRLVMLPWLLVPIAAMLIKTSRMYRLFISRVSAAGNWSLTTQAQLVYVTALAVLGVSIELAVTLRNSDSVKTHYTATFTYKTCEGHSLELLLDGYILLLLCVTTFLAFRLRKMPSLANESRFLFLSSFCVFGTWLLATPLYFLAEDFQQPLLGFRIIGQTLSMWTWIFLPRLYMLKNSTEKVSRLKVQSSRIRSIPGGRKFSLFSFMSKSTQFHSNSVMTMPAEISTHQRSVLRQYYTSTCTEVHEGIAEEECSA